MNERIVRLKSFNTWRVPVSESPIMADHNDPRGSLLPGDQLPVAGQATHIRRLALRLDVYRRVAEPQIGQRDTAPGPRQRTDFGPPLR
jgi:hypothetical protein